MDKLVICIRQSEHSVLVIVTVQRHCYCVSKLSYSLSTHEGKLTSEQISAGYSALKKIEECLKKKKGSSRELREACNQFYTRIPHDFGYEICSWIGRDALMHEGVDDLVMTGFQSV